MTYFRYSLSSTLVSFSYLDANTFTTEQTWYFVPAKHHINTSHR
ncbi:hypothetical protein VCRA2113O415_120009 [Vibrio crassostreae]|nr:hypothetical protein VCRA2113O415_120009 [Vibrio crassostreae]CAK2554616.1 hypothetical protein VCRA2113O420_130104 [Vibrio crassostreae]